MPRVRRLGTYGPQNGRSGRRVLGCLRHFRDKGKRVLLLPFERVLAFFAKLLIQPHDGALTFTVELGLHGVLLDFQSAFRRIAD